MIAFIDYADVPQGFTVYIEGHDATFQVVKSAVCTVQTFLADGIFVSETLPYSIAQRLRLYNRYGAVMLYGKGGGLLLRFLACCSWQLWVCARPSSTLSSVLIAYSQWGRLASAKRMRWQPVEIRHWFRHGTILGFQ